MKMEQLTDIPGFPSLDDCSGQDGLRAKSSTGKVKKSGGFQSMGLSFELMKGITKRGYKVPTPIQRKTIPLILEGRDVVAMAKTGSGKTACFLIPLFERLRRRDPTKGARALLMEPTRELAVQTYKFIKELGKFLDLKTILVLGGDSMDSQFSAIHTCPDIIVATPGRFLHLCVEMDLKLHSIEYVVFDEGDRLFEMGFREQMNEILNRLPDTRQTVMFSATLPKLLIDFAKAGLTDPVLIRLDVETKLPEALMLKFVFCRPEDRFTTLIVLLKYLIPKDAQTVVFVGTQFFLDPIAFVLTQMGITSTSVYSSLDPTARKINTAKFLNKKVSVLLVTDVAARGIDIPNMDYVINFHFPGKPKLFVHRVGRCARAGRAGIAYSIFSTDDAAHLLDLHLFLNRTFDDKDNSAIGTIQQDLLEEEHLSVTEILKNPNISAALRISSNAYKKYIVSRPVASADANARAKKIHLYALKPLEDFVTAEAVVQQLTVARDSASVVASKEQVVAEERSLHNERHNILVRMRNFRPPGTIFELNCTRKSMPFTMMKEKRSKYSEVIEKFHQEQEHEKEHKAENEHMNRAMDADDIDEAAIKDTFMQVVAPKRRPNVDDRKDKTKRKMKRPTFKDAEHFVPYQSADKNTEDGLAVDSFERQARNAEFSVMNGEIGAGSGHATSKHNQQQKKWDRVKKKMVTVQDPRAGKIRTESGVWIAASYKTNRYSNWMTKSKIMEQLQREAANDGDDTFKPLSHEQRYPVNRNARHRVKMQAKLRMGVGSAAGSEIRNPEQIVKERMRLEYIKKRNSENAARKLQNRKRSMRKNQRERFAAKEARTKGRKK